MLCGRFLLLTRAVSYNPNLPPVSICYEFLLWGNLAVTLTTTSSWCAIGQMGPVLMPAFPGRTAELTLEDMGQEI